MTSTPPRMATALFTPDGDAHELLTIREPGWTPRTRYFRIERPGMTRQQCRS